MYSQNLPNESLSTTTITTRAARGGISAFTSTRRQRSKQPRDLPVVQSFANRILSALDEEDLKRLQPFLEPVHLGENDNLYQPEDEIRFVYFPESAVVSQFHILEDGRAMEIAMIGRDGAAGCAALYGAATSDCWSQISVAGGAFKMSVETLAEEFNRGGSLQKLLLRFASRYTAQISRSVVCNNYHSVERRFCTWLLMLCDRRGCGSVSLTHSQIAGYLGVHRPSFTHIARNLREKGIIEYTRGQLKIANRSDLLESACDCYTAIV